MAKKKASDAPVMEVMAAPNEEPVEEEKKAEATFSKKQLRASKKFGNRTDALEVILKDDERYTIAECEKLLNDFLKGKV
ncbi:MAG: hypothetical protein LUD72_14625 [Bacteroidales bacterium]|nr:hypothetical protein [Bacteroidales bacterium]